MSDPSFEVEQEAPPPPMPPRPTSAQRQLEADEAYARRLAQKYQSRDSRRYQAAQRQSQEQEKGFFDGVYSLLAVPKPGTECSNLTLVRFYGQ